MPLTRFRSRRPISTNLPSVFAQVRSPRVRVLSSAPGRTCPVCNSNLSQATLAESPILFCTACKGMGVPAELLDQALNDNPSASAPDPSICLECPVCHGPMDRNLHPHQQGEVPVDTCGHCLLNWLALAEAHSHASLPVTHC